MNSSSKLSLHNKLILYKAILKPRWTYGVELWGSAKPANIQRIQSFQFEVLRTILNAPWYVSNHTTSNDLNIPTVSEVIKTNVLVDTIYRMLHDPERVLRKD
jgi:hypothetical protein